MLAKQGRIGRKALWHLQRLAVEPHQRLLEELVRASAEGSGLEHAVVVVDGEITILERPIMNYGEQQPVVRVEPQR